MEPIRSKCASEPSFSHSGNVYMAREGFSKLWNSIQWLAIWIDELESTISPAAVRWGGNSTQRPDDLKKVDMCVYQRAPFHQFNSLLIVRIGICERTGPEGSG